MSSIHILMRKSTHLIGITSKDDVVYLLNNAYANLKLKAGPSDIVVHVSFPIVYPRFDELYFNPAALGHLTNEFNNRFVTSLSGDGSTDSYISSLTFAIKDSVDIFRNNKNCSSY